MKNKNILALLIAQFLSAFADNAVLFTVVAMSMKNSDTPAWYVPALQSAFLVAFVVLAPWVGHWANCHPKAKLLIVANLIKAGGVLLLLLNVEPLLAYALVGVGAALYSPAKYGILPELTDSSQLVKVNGWVEGSTILAILAGMLVGSKVADIALTLALITSAGLYILSAGMAMVLPKTQSELRHSKTAFKGFADDLKTLVYQERARFALIGTALFWSTSAVLRVIIIAWCPLVLNLMNVSDIAQLTLFLAIGIMTGAVIVPKLIDLKNINKVRFPAYVMGVLILGLGFVDQLNVARIVLFAIGFAGGLFIVPINAALQDAGHETVGSGSAVALQNFFENLSMLITVGGYTYLASIGLEPALTIKLLGGMLLLTSLTLALSFPVLRLKNVSDKDSIGG